MGDKVNIFLDNLLSLCWRLLDLPLILILPIALLLSFLSVLFFQRIFFRNRNKSLSIPIILSLFFAFALIVDRKMQVLKGQINELNQKLIQSIGENKQNQAFYPVKEITEFNQLKESYSGEFECKVNQIHPSIDLCIMKREKGEKQEAMAYLALIDLQNPAVSIKITPEFKEKYLTSRFAQKENCLLAINGEAGRTMMDGCGLGEWTGNWIVNGKAVLLEDSADRPFLSFDKNNKGKYFKSETIDQQNSPEKYNTIWGRYDILIDGEVLPNEKRSSYPRTVMGINQSGTKLYLLIVDGKRPGHSLGLQYQESAAILKAAGAANAMACDQGGSSCMYLNNRIITVPADSEGIERRVYSHFGISVE